MFAGLYEDAKKRNDTALQQKIVKRISCASRRLDRVRRATIDESVGYEPKQILLLHASNLEADHIGELLDLLRKRGYRFITLEDALSDQAYSLPDTYVGEEGIRLDRALGDHAGKDSARRSGNPAVGDRSHEGTAHVDRTGVGGNAAVAAVVMS